MRERPQGRILTIGPAECAPPVGGFPTHLRLVESSWTLDEKDWRHYLAAYHETRPGITERLFQQAEGSPYTWLAELLRPVEGTVLDVACGSAPLRRELPAADWVGLDSSAGELAEAARRGRGPLIRADADALPVATGSVDAVCASMCLPVLTPLTGALAEMHRVLRPGGLLAALVPARAGTAPAGLLSWARVMASVRAARQPWPNPQARDTTADVLRQAGFRVQRDERRVFPLALETPDDTDSLVDGLYLPHLTPERARVAKANLAHWARPGRTLPLPLRRVLAVGGRPA